MADINELILVVSESMNLNKKQNRNENELIRVAAATRRHMNFKNDTISLTTKRNDDSVTVGVFHAFITDIRRLQESGKYTPEQIKRVGFVTSEVFNKINNIDVKPKDKPKDKPAETLIGADPEFLLFNVDGDVVSANNVMSKAGKIGSDGAMAEIRPDPATDPSVLVDNITTLLTNKEITKYILPYSWIAGVYHKDGVRDYPIGGHIHLGNPADINKLSTERKMFLFAVINKIMDELLAVPLVKLDGDELGKHRRSECKMALGNMGYGYYGEWRQCDGRLEHRTLSGLWLMHPEIAKCVLGTAKAIANEVFGILSSESYKDSMFLHPTIHVNDHKSLYRAEFDDWESISIAKMLGCTRASSSMKVMLDTSKARHITKNFLSEWYTRMKGLSTYNKYSAYIDKMYAILSLPRNEAIKVGFNIKENWVDGKPFKI